MFGTIVAGLMASGMSGGSEDASATTSREPTRTREQREALRRLIEQLESGELDMGAPGITAQEDEVLSSIMGGLPQRRQELSALGGQAATSASGLDELEQAITGSGLDRVTELLGSRDEFDELYRTAVEQPLTEQFQEEIIPGIGDRFGGAGFFSSERRDAEQDAMEGLAQELAAGRAQTAIQAPLQAVDALGGLTAAGSNIAGARRGAAGTAADIAGMETGLDDLAIRASSFDRLARENQSTRRLQALLNAIGQPTFENITTVDPGQQGFVGSFARGLGSSLGSLGSGGGGGQ